MKPKYVEKTGFIMELVLFVPLLLLSRRALVYVGVALAGLVMFAVFEIVLRMAIWVIRRFRPGFVYEAVDELAVKMVGITFWGVVGVIGVAVIVFFNLNDLHYSLDYMGRARITAATEMVETLKNSIAIYKTHHRKAPTDLKQLTEGEDALIEGGEGVLIDPWGNEYQYRIEGKKSLIWSFGPDGKDDTDDDIRSDKIKNNVAS